MSEAPNIPGAALLQKGNYAITTLTEEIRADQHCAALLRQFHRHLLEEQQLPPLDAGALAAGADYFLREFIIGSRRENILEIPAERIRQFAGNWYIIRNLEPNLEELTDMLRGTAAFYRYGVGLNLVAAHSAGEISAECDKLGDFARRIEEFHAIRNDGFRAWDRACPLD